MFPTFFLTSWVALNGLILWYSLYRIGQSHIFFHFSMTVLLIKAIGKLTSIDYSEYLSYNNAKYYIVAVALVI